MKQVSNAYKLSMKSLLREQSFVEITFSQVDTAAAKQTVIGSATGRRAILSSTRWTTDMIIRSPMQRWS